MSLQGSALSLFTALHSATEAFSRLKGEKVKVSELKPIMEYLSISLTDREYEEALKNVTVDGECRSCVSLVLSGDGLVAAVGHCESQRCIT